MSAGLRALAYHLKLLLPSVVDVFVLMYFLSRNCGIKERFKGRYVVLNAVGVVTWALIVWRHYVDPNFLFYYSLLALNSIVYSVLFLEKGPTAKVVTVITFYVSMFAVHSLSYRLLDIVLRGTLPYNHQLHLLVSKVTLCGLVFVMIRYACFYGSRLPRSYGLLMVVTIVLLPLFPIVQHLSAVEVGLSFSRIMVEISAVVMTQLMMQVSVIVLYFIFCKVAKDYTDKINYRMMNQHLVMTQENQRIMDVYFERLKSMRHDMQHHISCMSTMLEKRDYDDLHTYFGEMLDHSPLHEPVILTGNHAIDSVVNTKHAVCMAKGVAFHPHIAIPAEMGIRQYDLSALLGNVLDNAIEATEATGAPGVELQMKTVGGYLLIEVKNHVEENVLTANPRLLTTKDDASFHGFGIALVKAICSKYNGTVEFSCTDHTFSTQIAMQVGGE